MIINKIVVYRVLGLRLEEKKSEMLYSGFGGQMCLSSKAKFKLLFWSEDSRGWQFSRPSR